MKKHNRKRGLNIRNSVLDQIVSSGNLREKEKIAFLRYVGYLDYEEQNELLETL